MKIGMIGAGKLGLPVALAINSKGHDVCVYDINPAVEDYLNDRVIPFREEGIQPLLDYHTVEWKSSIEEAVKSSEIVFLPIQTPHEPEFEGNDALPDRRADFDYSWLKSALSEAAQACEKLQKPTIVAVISTCLPGTFERELKPLLNEYVSYVYTPQFIAMGCVIQDYLYPEFNLIGVADPDAAETLEQFYATINNSPSVKTDITTAEGAKVAYNSFLTAKTVLGNIWGELSERIGMDFDAIKKTWDLATRRLLSSRYLDAGLSDGGGCFPPGELVMGEHGPRPIESIEVGDRVLTVDGSLQPVVKTWVRDYDDYLVRVKGQGESLMTRDHPVIVQGDGGYAEIAAKDLTLGQCMIWPSGPCGYPLPEYVSDVDKWLPIERLETVKYQGPVHNLWVAENNTYVVAAGAVHNCHPRDNIAMSWIAQREGMSHNLWEDLMAARQDYEAWHADLAARAAEERNLPLILLGRAFKPETDIETGSAAILMSNILRRNGVEHEHVNDVDSPPVAVYFISTKNSRYAEYMFPQGSVVLDPFGIIPDRDGVTVRRLGRK